MLDVVSKKHFRNYEVLLANRVQFLSSWQQQTMKNQACFLNITIHPYLYIHKLLASSCLQCQNIVYDLNVFTLYALFQEQEKLTQE